MKTTSPILIVKLNAYKECELCHGDGGIDIALGILDGKAKIVFKDNFELTTEELLDLPKSCLKTKAELSDLVIIRKSPLKSRVKSEFFRDKDAIDVLIPVIHPQVVSADITEPRRVINGVN